MSVSDYWADNNEVKHEYNLNLINDVNFDDYESIVMAVSHDKYKTLIFKNENQVIYDIKSILKNSDGRL